MLGVAIAVTVAMAIGGVGQHHGAHRHADLGPVMAVHVDFVRRRQRLGRQLDWLRSVGGLRICHDLASFGWEIAAVLRRGDKV